MKKNITFLKYRYVAYVVSLVLFLVFAVGTFLIGEDGKKGLNWGIDFKGGIKITGSFASGVSEGNIREVLGQSGLKASVQKIGAEEKNDYIISTKLLDLGKTDKDGNVASEGKVAEQTLKSIKDLLNASFTDMKYLSVETVGPAIGEFLKKSAFKLSLLALLMMMLYLTFRFEVRYAVGAIIALFHDIILALMFCGIAGVEINTPVLAALLTIFGYSVNDTIVIYDRIRENMDLNKSASHFDVINKSISQSLSRTLLTSVTTLLAVSALYFIGGDVINDFAVVLLFGVIVGTYSSIYVASPIVLLWEKISGNGNAKAKNV